MNGQLVAANEQIAFLFFVSPHTSNNELICRENHVFKPQRLAFSHGKFNFFPARAQPEEK